MQEVLEATAARQQQQSTICIAAQYGLNWRLHIWELLVSSGSEVIHGYDILASLRLFMLATMGGQNDLSVIYDMMRMGPEVLSKDMMKTRKLV